MLFLETKVEHELSDRNGFRFSVRILSAPLEGDVMGNHGDNNASFWIQNGDVAITGDGIFRYHSSDSLAASARAFS